MIQATERTLLAEQIFGWNHSHYTPRNILLNWSYRVQPWTTADGTLPAVSFIDVASGAEKKAERPEEGASICNPAEAAAVLQLLIDLHVRFCKHSVVSWKCSRAHQTSSCRHQPLACMVACHGTVAALHSSAHANLDDGVHSLCRGRFGQRSSASKSGSSLHTAVKCSCSAGEWRSAACWSAARAMMQTGMVCQRRSTPWTASRCYSVSHVKCRAGSPLQLVWMPAFLRCM